MGCTRKIGNWQLLTQKLGDRTQLVATTYLSPIRAAYKKGIQQLVTPFD